MPRRLRQLSGGCEALGAAKTAVDVPGNRFPTGSDAIRPPETHSGNHTANIDDERQFRAWHHCERPGGKPPPAGTTSRHHQHQTPRRPVLFFKACRLEATLQGQKEVCHTSCTMQTHGHGLHGEVTPLRTHHQPHTCAQLTNSTNLVLGSHTRAPCANHARQAVCRPSRPHTSLTHGQTATAAVPSTHVTTPRKNDTTTREPQTQQDNRRTRSSRAFRAVVVVAPASSCRHCNLLHFQCAPNTLGLRASSRVAISDATMAASQLSASDGFTPTTGARGVSNLNTAILTVPGLAAGVEALPSSRAVDEDAVCFGSATCTSDGSLGCSLTTWRVTLTTVV